MRIGYLMNIYPMTSATFIRREIQAIEASGIVVTRYAIRPWTEHLVDEQDRAEKEKTFYLLIGRLPALSRDFFLEALANPIGMCRALAGCFKLYRNAGRRFVAHVAYLLEAVSLKRQTSKDDITHLHTHFSTNSAAVAMLCARLGGPGYSFTAHGPDEFVDWGRASLAMKVAEARFVFAISNYCRVQLARAAGMECWDKLHIVRCGVSIEEFPRSEAPFDKKAPFVCVGRLCSQKAQALIVEAVARLVPEYPDLSVILVGDGESRADIEAAITRHGVQKNVILEGWCDNAKVRELLGNSRALLLPSFAEGLPVVIMEALAIGRPAISTYIAGIPELVDEKCGWIIPAGSVDHIVAVMRQSMMASEKELVTLGSEGRERVKRDHNISTNAAAILGLFKSVHIDEP